MKSIEKSWKTLVFKRNLNHSSTTYRSHGILITFQLNYYRQVHSEYPAWFDAYDKSPKLRIDGTTYDFVNNSDDLNTVLKQIEKALELRNKI